MARHLRKVTQASATFSRNQSAGAVNTSFVPVEFFTPLSGVRRHKLWSDGATTPLGAGTMSRDDSGCDPARGCRWLHMSGNCFHCVQHPGAVHVCDMRCRFRDVAVSETGAISYRCRVSGLVTSRRLCVGLAPTDANVRKRGADGEEAGADRGPLRKMG